jgi:hypothetical protein
MQARFDRLRKVILVGTLSWAATSLVVLVLGTGTANAQFTIVVPNANANAEANGADNFLPGSGCGQQQLFVLDSSQFSTLSSGDQITGFAIRPDVNFCAGNPCGSFAATTLHNVTIKLATTSTAATDTSDGTIADFLTTNEQTVFSGDVTVASGFTGPTNGPKDFDIQFPFTTPYSYHPANGNLVVNLIVNSTDGIPVQIDGATSSGVSSRIFACASGQFAGSGIHDQTAVAVIQFQVSPPPCVPAPSGLVAWWPGDGNADDILGGHNGNLENGATFTTGLVGQAFSFDGSDDFVQAPDSPKWAFDSNDFTIDLWVNFNSVGTIDALVANDEGSGALNKWIFLLNNGQLQFHINSPTIGNPGVNIGSTSFSPNPGEWHHVAVTRSGTSYTFYVDGTPGSSVTNSMAVPDANAALTIGEGENNFFVNGLIDEVEIFDRALSTSEIQDIVNAGSSGKCKLDHFLCYKSKAAKARKGQPPFPEFTPQSVTLTDLFGGPFSFALKKSIGLCTPANKMDENPSAPNDPGHEEAYRSKRPKGAAKFNRVGEVHSITNQFHSSGFMVKLTAEDRFLVPTSKVVGTGGNTTPPPRGLDHFKCYKIAPAKAPKGQPAFPKFTPIANVKVADQFETRFFDLKALKHLCNPADKNGEDASAPAHIDHLVCYLAKLTKTDPKQAKVPKELVSTNNQFGQEVLQTLTVQELCVPSSLDD